MAPPCINPIASLESCLPDNEFAPSLVRVQFVCVCAHQTKINSHNKQCKMLKASFHNLHANKYYENPEADVIICLQSSEFQISVMMQTTLNDLTGKKGGGSQHTCRRPVSIPRKIKLSRKQDRKCKEFSIICKHPGRNLL